MPIYATPYNNPAYTQMLADQRRTERTENTRTPELNFKKIALITAKILAGLGLIIAGLILIPKIAPLAVTLLTAGVLMIGSGLIDIDNDIFDPQQLPQ